MADSREHQFQSDIINEMTAGGWLTGSASGYDRASALYTKDLLGYVQEAWPERWEKFCKANPQAPESVFVKKLVRELEQAGTLEVLRHGFKVLGVKFDLCSFQPDHGMNPDSLARYRANRLRVVPEVAYSPHARDGDHSYNPRLDLVLFVNGWDTSSVNNMSWMFHLASAFNQPIGSLGNPLRLALPPLFVVLAGNSRHHVHHHPVDSVQHPGGELIVISV